MVKVSRCFTLSTVALAALACESEPAGLRTLPVLSITVTPNVLTLPVGASAALTAAVRDLEGRPLEEHQVRWFSSAPAIVDVSAAGVVTALAPGVASIGAYSDQNVGFARVVVQVTFRLPVVAAGSVLFAEIGTLTALCPAGEGGLRADGGRDCSHAGVSRYSLDFRPAPDDPGATTVVAAADGTVGDICIQPPSEATCGPNGPFVYIEHGAGFATFYAHLDPATVSIRRKTAVTQGDVLGTMGEWGAEGHPWMHFELRLDHQDPGDRTLDNLLVEGRKLTEYRVGQ
jgi:murein DD-endopeptidase MepM/ murein hydrolase activator NlpD